MKFSLIEKIFREINYLVISLVKTLLSRNFCQKGVKDNFRNFHTAQKFPHCVLLSEISDILRVWKTQSKNSSSLFRTGINKSEIHATIIEHSPLNYAQDYTLYLNCGADKSTANVSLVNKSF